MHRPCLAMFVAMSPSEVNDNLLIRVFWKTPGKPKNQKTKIAQTMSVEMGSPEITHGLCNFGFLVFWFFHGKPKNQNCTDHVCRDGLPRDHPWSVQFWFFVFWFSQVFWFSSSEALPKGSQIFFCGVQFWVFGFLGFPPKPKMAQTMSVLIGSPEIIPWSVPFWVFGFLGFIYKWPPPLKHLFSMKTCLEVGSRGGDHIYIYYIYITVCTYVCMYLVCMHVCTYECMYVCMYVRMYVCSYVCTYVCMYVCTYVCMHACMYVCMYVRIYVCMYACTYVCMYVCMYVM